MYARLPKDDVRSGAVAVNGRDDGARYETGRTGGGLCYVRVTMRGVGEGLMLGAQTLQSVMVARAGDECRGEPSAAFPVALEGRRTRVPSEPATGAPEETPVYEHHGPAAELVWRTLPERVVVREQTDEEPDGRQRHIEYGRCGGNFRYLYWANTYDQRQIVMMEYDRRALLKAYYAESTGGQ